MGVVHCSQISICGVSNLKEFDSLGVESYSESGESKHLWGRVAGVNCLTIEISEHLSIQSKYSLESMER